MGQRVFASGFCIPVLLCCLWSSANAVAQDENLGDLRFGAAYLRARSQSPEIDAANSGIAAAIAAHDTARAAEFPQIGAKGDYDYTHDSVKGDYYGITDIDRSDTYNRYAYGFGLTQGIYRPDLLGAADLTAVGITASQLILTETESQVAVLTARQYLAVVDAMETLRAQIAQLSATQEQERQSDSRLSSGLVKQSDVALVRAARAIAEADKIEAENDVEAARLQLQLTVAGDFKRVAILMPQTPLPPLQPATLETWIATALDKRAALAAAKQGTEAARLQVGIAKSKRLPTLDLVGSHAYFDADGGISGARRDLDQRIGLEVKVPIFTSGLISANIAHAEAVLDQATSKENSALRQIKSGVQIAFMKALSAYRQLDARKRAVDAALNAEQTTLVGYQVGTETAADWLDSVRKRYNAERDSRRERLGYLQSLVELKAAAGVLGREDMGRIELLLKFPDADWMAPPDLKSAIATPDPIAH